MIYQTFFYQYINQGTYQDDKFSFNNPKNNGCTRRWKIPETFHIITLILQAFHLPKTLQKSFKL